MCSWHSALVLLLLLQHPAPIQKGANLAQPRLTNARTVVIVMVVVKRTVLTLLG